MHFASTPVHLVSGPKRGPALANATAVLAFALLVVVGCSSGNDANTEAASDANAASDTIDEANDDAGGDEPSDNGQDTGYGDTDDPTTADPTTADATTDSDTVVDDNEPAVDDVPDPGEVAAVASSGCVAPDDTPDPNTTQTFMADGVERSYLITIPSMPNADDDIPVPAIVDFHGYSEGAVIHTMMTDLRSLGQREGFVTVTPQGSGEVALWDISEGSNDMVSVGALLDDVEGRFCVDTNRIYATGLSNGAFMTSAVSCTYADRFAAAAPVAGISELTTCEPARPVPVVAFHGTDDLFVSFEGGLGEAVATLPNPDGNGTIDPDAEPGEAALPTDDSLTVPEVAAAWAERNGCADNPVDREVGTTEEDEPIRVLSWDGCAHDADVGLYVIEGGGHTWPGSPFSKSIEDLAPVGLTTLELDANEVMWQFFQDHPLR